MIHWASTRMGLDWAGWAGWASCPPRPHCHRDGSHRGSVRLADGSTCVADDHGNCVHWLAGDHGYRVGDGIQP